MLSSDEVSGSPQYSGMIPFENASSNSSTFLTLMVPGAQSIPKGGALAFHSAFSNRIQVAGNASTYSVNLMSGADIYVPSGSGVVSLSGDGSGNVSFEGIYRKSIRHSKDLKLFQWLALAACSI